MKQAIDIHTHRPARPGDLMSAGLHPWRSAEADPELMRAIDKRIRRPEVVAIGEVGLDALRGAPLDVQEELFEHYIDLSEELGKPLIIHCVRAWDRLLSLYKRRRPSQPWAIHGFRGKPELARQLLDAGMYISLGPRHNPATAAIVPSGRLLIETDDDPEADINALAELLPAYDPATSLRFLGLGPEATPGAIVNMP
ncbi:MAG: TatD family hydrolase [Muribaculaceae bacterium]|nr:TatD family hydrolase [Muribaculaceae bacterium]